MYSWQNKPYCCPPLSVDQILLEQFHIVFQNVFLFILTFILEQKKRTYSLEHFMLLLFFRTMSVDEQDVLLLLPSVVFYHLNIMLEAPFIYRHVHMRYIASQHFFFILLLFAHQLIVQSFLIFFSDKSSLLSSSVHQEKKEHICIGMAEKYLYTHVHRLKI